MRLSAMVDSGEYRGWRWRSCCLVRYLLPVLWLANWGDTDIPTLGASLFSSRARYGARYSARYFSTNTKSGCHIVRRKGL